MTQLLVLGLSQADGWNCADPPGRAGAVGVCTSTRTLIRGARPAVPPFHLIQVSTCTNLLWSDSVEKRHDGLGEPLEHLPVLFVGKHGDEIIEAESLIAAQGFCHMLWRADGAGILRRLQDSTGSQSLCHLGYSFVQFLLALYDTRNNEE